MICACDEPAGSKLHANDKSLIALDARAEFIFKNHSYGN